MNCSNCGEVASNNVNFCRRCGSALAHHDPESTSTITRLMVSNATPVFPQMGSQVVPLSQRDSLSQDTAPNVSTPDNKELIHWARTAAMKKIFLTVAIVAFALLVLNLLSAFFGGGVEVSATNAAPSVVEQFKVLALVLLRLTMVVAVPLFPSILFWKIAYSLSLDIYHKTLVRFIMIGMYLVFATAALVILFPLFVISRLLLQVLR